MHWLFMLTIRLSSGSIPLAALISLQTLQHTLNAFGYPGSDSLCYD